MAKPWRGAAQYSRRVQSNPYAKVKREKAGALPHEMAGALHSG